MSSEQRKPTRCAIYTRKSSEEGLDQAFNSLDAQREACEAYILSQRHEGWRVLPTHYDDGGYSGGNMDRPALKQLLADIEQGKVNTVVVYKVDRLTRSLADFVRIIEILDTRKVSFVSITQQFNTTSSMGRLTLNVLLSFAQFEREVTGERIRDKIAASKRKGMWMGGLAPLGYDVENRKLTVVPADAERVRWLYQRYLKLGCVSKLKTELDRRGFKSKRRTTSTGREFGGTPYSRGALYQILQNPIYRGEVHHQGQIHQGEHEAIIPKELWDQVQTKLRDNNQARRNGLTAKAPSLLTGLLYDVEDNRFTPSHAVKNGKRYRYYVCQPAQKNKLSDATATRIPAHELERLISSRVLAFLKSPNELLMIPPRSANGNSGNSKSLIVAAQRFADQWDRLPTGDRRAFLQTIIDRVTIHEDKVELLIKKKALYRWLRGSETDSSTSVSPQTVLRLTIEASLARSGCEVRFITAQDFRDSARLSPPLIKAVSRARDWFELLVAGELTGGVEIAELFQLDERYVYRILEGAFLAPDIVQMILDGQQTRGLSLEALLRRIPPDWQAQRLKFGFVRQAPG